jgi:hypothetical protein
MLIKKIDGAERSAIDSCYDLNFGLWGGCINLNGRKHCPDNHAVFIGIAVFIVAPAGDQGQPWQFLMLDE